MTPPRRPGPILFNVSNEYRRISSSLSEHQVVSTRPSSPPSPAHVSVRITTNPFKPAISAGPHGGPGGRLSIDATFFKGVTRGWGGGGAKMAAFLRPQPHWTGGRRPAAVFLESCVSEHLPEPTALRPGSPCKANANDSLIPRRRGAVMCVFYACVT